MNESLLKNKLLQSVATRNEVKAFLFRTILISLDGFNKREFEETILKELLQKDENFAKQFIHILLFYYHSSQQQQSHEFLDLLFETGLSFRDFFKGKKERIRKWFGHFSFSNPPLYGSLYLEHYILANRDAIWTSLHWKSKQVTPIVAVNNRWHFMELDIFDTISNILQQHKFNDFWNSSEFKASVLESSSFFLALDYDFFEAEFLKLFHKQEKQKVNRMIHLFIENNELTDFFGQLLYSLSDQSLLQLTKGIANILNGEDDNFSMIFTVFAKSKTFDELLFSNALIIHSASSHKMVLGNEEEEEDNTEEKQMITEIVNEMKSGILSVSEVSLTKFSAWSFGLFCVVLNIVKSNNCGDEKKCLDLEKMLLEIGVDFERDSKRKKKPSDDCCVLKWNLPNGLSFTINEAPQVLQKWFFKRIKIV